MYFLAKLRGVIVILGIILASEARGSDLASQHKVCISTPAGKAYETIATKTFWSNLAFMFECAPPTDPIPEPIQIYYKVGLDGTIIEMSMQPDNEVANCIKRHVSKRIFPKPPNGKTWVGDIFLRFSQ